MIHRLKVEVNGKWYVVEVEDLATDPVRTVVDGYVVEVSLSGQAASQESGQAETRPSTPPPEVQVSAPAPQSTPSSAPVRPAQPPVVSGPPAAVKTFTAPMPGTILSILVGVGDQVVTGDTVCILEAMKMQQSLRADWSGVVKAIYVDVGQQVLGGESILALE